MLETVTTRAVGTMCAIMLMVTPAIADTEPTSVFCVPAADASGIIDAVAPGAQSIEMLRGLLGLTFGIRIVQSTYVLNRNGVIANAPLHSPSPSDSRKRACTAIRGGTVLLNETNQIPGDILAAFEAVIVHRKDVSWPRQPVDASDPTTSVSLWRYPMYVLVGLERAYVPSSGGCDEETYRVDVPSLIVRPFESCIEAHKPSGLPQLDELPTPNTPLTKG
jgi:hypothetical protein